MPSYTQTLTNNGATALDTAWTGTPPAITRVSVGSGSVANPLTATALGSEKISAVSIAGAAILSNGSFALSIVVNNASVTTAFNMTEVGIWGTVGGGPEQLLIYISDSAPTTIGTNATAQNVYLRVGVQASNATSVTVTITPGVYALESDFVSHLADAGAHPQAFQNPVNVVTATFPGTLPHTPTAKNNSYITNADGSGAWVLGVNYLSVNTTLYVATTGNDMTAVPNDPAHPWASLQGAHDWLLGYFILPNVTVTIQIAAGNYNGLSAINITHPQSGSVQIIGTLGTTKTITGSTRGASIVTLSAAAGTFSGMVAGDVFTFVSTATIFANQISGVFLVSGVAVDGSTLTYNCNSTQPSGYINPTTGTVLPLKTKLAFASGQSGITIGEAGISLIKNLALVQSSASSTVVQGLSISSSAVLDTIGALNWHDTGVGNSAGIIGLRNSTTNASRCFSEGCDSGFIVIEGGSFTASGSYANSNFQKGFNTAGSSMTLTGCVACSDSQIGFLSSSQSRVQLAGCSASFNAVGVQATASSDIITTAANGFSTNSTDVVLQLMSLFTRQAGGANGWTTKSANITAVNTLTADGCYFSP